MAKQGKTGALGWFAFGAMVLNAIAWVLQALNLLGISAISKVAGILLSVANLVLVGVVLVVAYDFAKHQSKNWRIIYWVLAILTVCAVLFGFGVNFVR